jgi:hypothetical protein
MQIHNPAHTKLLSHITKPNRDGKLDNTAQSKANAYHSQRVGLFFVAEGTRELTTPGSLTVTTARQTDRQRQDRGRQTDRQTERKTDRQIETDRQKDRQIDRQADRQRETETE